MTDERQALFEQIEKRADSDFVRELLAFAAERLMTVEVEALTGAAHGERTPERVNHRNGYRERAWETRAGRIDLQPVRRSPCGRFSPVRSRDSPRNLGSAVMNTKKSCVWVIGR